MTDGGLHRVSQEKTAAPIVRTGRVRRAGSRRQAFIALFVVAVIGGLMAGGYFLFVPGERDFTVTDATIATVTVETLLDTVELGGTVSARTTAIVTAPESGFLETLVVDEGDWVAAGSVLAILDTPSLDDDLVSLERSLERSLRELDRFTLQHEYDLRSFERQRDKLEQALENARADLAETRELFEIGSATRTQVEDAEQAASDAGEAIADHEAEVEEAIALHELSLANYRDDIEATRLEIADIEERLAATTIRAPVSGRVVTIADAATVSGELLKQYASIVQIADTRDPLVESEIDEQYVPLIEVGREIAVETGGVRYEGAIERIGQIASTTNDGGTPTVEVDVAIETAGDGSQVEILPGASALVEVLIGRIDDALVLPRGPYLTSGNRRYLYRVSDGRADRIEVEYGTITEDRVQVVAGVAAGDRIITGSYQSYVDRESVLLEETP
ncbi:MAG: efflux RND transporter periplasmic adaptor subunit [Spirochaetota bacterium]